MKTHFLPETQDRRNKSVLRKLRLAGIFQLLLMIGIPLFAIWLWARPPFVPQTPRVMATDGGTQYCDAIFIGPDAVLCASDVPNAVLVEVNGERVLAHKINSGLIGDATAITLLQLQNAPSTVVDVNPVLAQSGEKVTALSNGSRWDGLVTDVQTGEYSVEPSFPLGPGVGVFAKSGPSELVGMSGQLKGHTTIIPITEVMKAVKMAGTK